MALVDPNVSRQKFERELENYRRNESDNISRGWWLLKAKFPEVFVVFATAKTQPPSVVFGVQFDFTDYDLIPPSVRFVHPLTRQPYLYEALPTKLPRRVPVAAPTENPAQPLINFQIHNLIVPPREGGLPFLCLPGVREYHEHPAHTGDSWLLHRGGTEGTLYFLIEKIAQYGVEPIHGFEMRLNVAFQQTLPPE